MSDVGSDNPTGSLMFPFKDPHHSVLLPAHGSTCYAACPAPMSPSSILQVKGINPSFDLGSPQIASLASFLPFDDSSPSPPLATSSSPPSLISSGKRSSKSTSLCPKCSRGKPAAAQPSPPNASPRPSSTSRLKSSFCCGPSNALNS